MSKDKKANKVVNFVSNLLIIWYYLRAMKVPVKEFIATLETHSPEAAESAQKVMKDFREPSEENQKNKFFWLIGIFRLGDRRKVSKAWRTMYEWCAVERTIEEISGHIYHLRKAGWYSMDAGFGVDYIVAKFFTGMVTLFTTAATLLAKTRTAGKTGARNKDAYYVRGKGRGLGYICIDHADNHVVEDDYGSIYHFMPGFVDRGNDVWSRGEEHRGLGRLDWSQPIIIAMDICHILRERFGIEATYHHVEGFLTIGDLSEEDIAALTEDSACVIAKRVYAELDTEGKVMDLVQIRSDREPGTIACLQFTRDLTTPCQHCKDGEGSPIHHPLVHENTVWDLPRELMKKQGKRRLPNSSIRVKCFTSWWRRGIDWIMSQGGTWKRIADLSDDRVDLLSKERDLQIIRNMVADKVPTDNLLELMVERVLTHEDAGWWQTPKALIVQYDIVGYTNRTGDDPEGFSRKLAVMLATLQDVAERYGFWEYQRIGDSAVLAYSLDFPRHEDELKALKWKTLQSAAEATIRMTDELHTVAKENNQLLRIGVNIGDVVWRDQNDPSSDSIKFHGVGRGLDDAARAESYISLPGTTGFTAPFMQVLTNTEAPALAHSVRGIEYCGLVAEKKKFVGGRVVQKRIEGWRKYVLSEIEISRISGEPIAPARQLPRAQEYPRLVQYLDNDGAAAANAQDGDTTPDPPAYAIAHYDEPDPFDGEQTDQEEEVDIAVESGNN